MAELVGRKVKRGKSVRTIVGIYPDIPGGVILDKPIEGFRSWNLDSLTLLEIKGIHGCGYHSLFHEE